MGLYKSELKFLKSELSAAEIAAAEKAAVEKAAADKAAAAKAAAAKAAAEKAAAEKAAAKKAAAEKAAAEKVCRSGLLILNFVTKLRSSSIITPLKVLFVNFSFRSVIQIAAFIEEKKSC